MDSQVYSASEHTRAETTDWGRGNFRQIDGSDDTGLSNADTSNKPTCVDGVHVAVVSHEDGNTQDPETAQLASSPNTPDTITDEKGTTLSHSQQLENRMLNRKTYRRAPATLPS